MSASMVGLPDEVLESTFVRGLKPEIRVGIRVLKPTGLGQLMEMAQLVEEKNMAIRSLKDPFGLRGTKPTPYNTSRAQEGGRVSDYNTKTNFSGACEGNKQ